MEKDDTTETQEGTALTEILSVAETPVSETSPEIQFDRETAPDSLIERLILNICINIQNVHQSIQDPSAIGIKIILLFNAILTLRSALGLQRVEIIVTAIYLSRVWEINANLITFDSLAKLMIGALIVAHRYCTDIYYPLSIWGEALGLKSSTIEQFMDQALEFLNYNVIVDPKEYQYALDQLTGQQ
ncbi:MAG: hypothetical protein EZS28_047285 [Streblomastix strix]|uniref:Cyclin N-terminal domain-containing protein n=1 Tax=Streblomastix strix TaxID=222440 RepID=A0A5J4TG14_9EUKA|nr:MAG: hypothetical protein EZS28_047285 [Streblomastix strix]